MATSTPSPTSRTWLNSTMAPASASSFSTRTTVPSLTRYCLPPVAMTAYMIEWTPKRARNCSEPTLRGQTIRMTPAFPARPFAARMLCRRRGGQEPMQLKDIRALVADDLTAVDAEITAQLASDVALVNQVGDY